MTKTDFGSKKLKRFLLAIIFVALGAVIITFSVYRQKPDKNELPEPVTQKDADVSLGKIHHTATKDGKPQWRLDADSAAYDNKKQSAKLKNIKLTFFVENRNPIYLTADKGGLNTRTNNIEVSGNVLSTHDDYQLKTEKLEYNHKKEILFTNVPVDISGEGHQIIANTMHFDLNSNKAQFEGNVKGIFNANFTF